MTRITRPVAIAAAVIATGAAAVTFGLTRTGHATPTAATQPPSSAHSAAPAAPAPPSTSAAPAPEPVHAATSAKPSAPAAPVAHAAAAPFIQTFADQPGVRPQPAKPSPKTTRSMPTNVDGCDHAYGTRTQCVPLAFPGGVTTVAGKCAWLAAHGFTELTVAGADRQKLDHNANRIACDG